MGALWPFINFLMLVCALVSTSCLWLKVRQMHEQVMITLKALARNKVEVMRATQAIGERVEAVQRKSDETRVKPGRMEG